MGETLMEIVLVNPPRHYRKRRNSPISKRDLNALRRIIKSHTKRKLARYRASAKKGRYLKRRKSRGR